MSDNKFEEVFENIFEQGDDNAPEALRLLINCGQIDGAHHKAWVIDQAVRQLAGGWYDELIAAANDGEDGPDTYTWDVGVPP
jgi:3-methyladenine DNA glycosylase AlkC